MRKLLLLPVFFLLSISIASALCTLDFEDSEYYAGDNVTATMICDNGDETGRNYEVTWTDETTGEVLEVDTGITPSSIDTEFYESYIIPLNWTDGDLLEATLTGEKLEGSDTAVVYNSYSLNASVTEPSERISVIEGGDFKMSCSVENDGLGQISDVELFARYDNGTVISDTSSSDLLTLNESGSHNCGTLDEGSTCNKTWNVTANRRSDDAYIQCYAENSDASSESEDLKIDVFESSNDLNVNLDSLSYSPGEVSTATMNSYFTEADYNVEWYNSTGGLICNETGTTPSSSDQDFLESCSIPEDTPYQDNNSVKLYINGDSSISTRDSFNITNVSSRSYSITEVLVKNDNAFLNEKQSVKATVIDSNNELAVGESCKISIYDLETESPIYDTDVTTIGGDGRCMAEFPLSFEDFDSETSYEVVIEAWQSSDEDLPAPDRKRGSGTASFVINPYVIEDREFLEVVNKDLHAGFDKVRELHSFTNNYGEVLEVVEDVWFSNTDTEQDYHYDSLENNIGSFNTGNTSKVDDYKIPEDLPSGTYRLERNIKIYYEGDLRTEYLLRSEDFNITSIQDTMNADRIRIRDGFGTEIDTHNNPINEFELPESNYTDPHYVLGEGYDYNICADFNNTYDHSIYLYLESLTLHNPSTGESYQEFNRNGDTWKKILRPGVNEVCYNDKIPVNIRTHSDWTFEFSAFIGDLSESYDCDDCNFFARTDHSYIGSLDDVIQISKWLEKPNSTSVGKPQTLIVTERDNPLSMNDDCEYETQSEIPWGESNVTCYDKNTGDPKKIDYTDYPIAGEKFKVCFQFRNYLSNEVELSLDQIYLDNDFSESVVYFQDENSDGYVPSTTNPSLYSNPTPSRDEELSGILEDGYGIMCSKWLQLPDDVVGSNNWDVQGDYRPISDDCSVSEKQFFESDEFPIYGRQTTSSSTEYFTINNFNFTKSNASEGEYLQFVANVTNNMPYDREVVFNAIAQANSNGILEEMVLKDYFTGEAISTETSSLGNVLETPFTVKAGKTATFKSRKILIPYHFTNNHDHNEIRGSFFLQMLNDDNEIVWTESYDKNPVFEVTGPALEFNNISTSVNDSIESCDSYDIRLDYDNPQSDTSSDIHEKIEEEEHYMMKVCAEDIVNDINLYCSVHEFQPDTGFNHSTIIRQMAPDVDNDTKIEIDVTLYDYDKNFEGDCYNCGDKVTSISGDEHLGEFNITQSDNPNCEFMQSTLNSDDQKLYLEWLQAEGVIGIGGGVLNNDEDSKPFMNNTGLDHNEVSEGDPVNFTLNVTKPPEYGDYYKVYYDFFKNNASGELVETLDSTVSGVGLKKLSFEDYRLPSEKEGVDYRIHSRISRVNDYGVWESYNVQDLGTITVYEESVPEELEGTLVEAGSNYSYNSNSYNVTFEFVNNIELDNISISGSGLLLDNSHNLSMVPSSDNVTVRVYSWDGYDHYFGILSDSSQEVGVDITVNGTEQFVKIDGDYTNDSIPSRPSENTWTYSSGEEDESGSRLTGYTFSSIKDSDGEVSEKADRDQFFDSKTLLIAILSTIIVLIVIALISKSHRKKRF